MQTTLNEEIVKHFYIFSAIFWISTTIFAGSPVFGKSKLSIDRHQNPKSDLRLAGSLVLGSGRTSQAIYEEGTKLLSDSPDFKNAVEVDNKKNYSLAIQYYNRTISKFPQSTIAYLYRGQCFYRLNQYDRAFADLNRAIQLMPNLGVAYLYRGYIYGRSGSFSLARNDFSIASKLAIDDNSQELYDLATKSFNSVPVSLPSMNYPTMNVPSYAPTVPYNPSSAITP